MLYNEVFIVTPTEGSSPVLCLQVLSHSPSTLNTLLNLSVP